MDVRVKELEESNQIWAEVANDLVEAIGRDKVQALIHVKRYVAELEAEVKRLRANQCDCLEGPRRALNKEGE